MIDRFGPDELASVELLPQFRKDLSIKFAAGRARERMKRQSDSAAPARAGTIACLSGLLFDMVGRTVRIVTPCPSSDDRPDGVHESAPVSFRDLDDAIRVIDGLLDHLRPAIPPDDAILQRSQGVEFETTSEPGVARIHSPHHAIRLQFPVEGDLMESGLPTRASTAMLFDAIAGQAKTEPLETLDILKVLLSAGVYRCQLPGEGDVPVSLGLSGVETV